jgi:hypothetical protein
MQIAYMQKVSVVYQTARAAIAMTNISDRPDRTISVHSFAISMPQTCLKDIEALIAVCISGVPVYYAWAQY